MREVTIKRRVAFNGDVYFHATTQHEDKEVWAAGPTWELALERLRKIVSMSGEEEEKTIEVDW